MTAEQYHVSFPIPSDAVPALKGLGGAKIKDVMFKTRTFVMFSKVSDVLHNVIVYGEPCQCDLACRIILHGIAHHQASLVTVTPINDRIVTMEDAKLDVRTVLSELEYRKCSS